MTKPKTPPPQPPLPDPLEELAERFKAGQQAAQKDGLHQSAFVLGFLWAVAKAFQTATRPAPPPPPGGIPFVGIPPFVLEAAYSTLGLQRGVGFKEARLAYRKAASAAHPDRGGTSERMTAVNQAWDIVKRDLETREG